MLVIPKTHMLKAVRDGGRADYLQLAGEGTDNGIEYGASEISIMIYHDEIRIIDDGRGIAPDRIPAMFTFGLHAPEGRGPKVGRYGVGIKTAALRCGDEIEVRTIWNGRSTRINCNWRELLESDNWEMVDPVWRPAPAGAPSGTTIIVRKLRKTPRLSDAKLRDELAMRFAPALRDGRRIIVNGVPVELLPDPDMDSIIEAELVFPGNRKALVRAGLLKGKSRLFKVHIAYQHRVIMPESSLGCGSYGGVTRLYAWVQLVGQWHLGQLKDDLPDETDRQELDAALLELLTPLLEHCHRETYTVELDHLVTLINDGLPENLRPARPKHLNPPQNRKGKKRGRSGFVAPEKSTSGGPATTVDFGDAANIPRKPRHRQAKLIIDFGDIAKTYGWGHYDDSGNNYRVTLAKDHPVIQRIINLKDKIFAADLLRQHAAYHYTHGIVVAQRTGCSPEIPDLEGTFGKRCADVLGRQDDDKAA